MRKQLSFRVDEDLLARFDAIARDLDRSRNWLIAYAMRHMVELHDTGGPEAVASLLPYHSGDDGGSRP